MESNPKSKSKWMRCAVAGEEEEEEEIVFERIKDTTIVSLLEFGIVPVVTTTSGMMSTI